MSYCFHLAPVSARQRIVCEGLRCGLLSNWLESRSDCVYLFAREEDAVAWAEHCNEQGQERRAPWDIWQVEAIGLALGEDPEEPWGYRSWMVAADIEPSRLTLLREAVE